jgi:hypothetical protein
MTSRGRSRFVSDAPAELVHACEAANPDLDGAEIEIDFDGIRDGVAEPWK